MKIKSIVVSLLISSLAMVFPLKSGAWFATDHTILASKGKQCVSLPKPPQKRCTLPVDEIFLKTLLWIGSMEADIKDGLSSSEYAFNPGYPDDKSWDPKIREELGMPNAQINAGTAIETIGTEINSIKNLLKLNCDSGLREYGQLWRQFGRLSHYPADLAIPIHTYSVGIDNEYHEGDIGSDGKWFKGLWDLPAGRALHGLFEMQMSFGLLGSSTCSSLRPSEVAQRARTTMRGYRSILSEKTGYEGLVNDFLLANQAFFTGIGGRQAKDALGGICSVWKEALQDWKPPQNCECQSSNQNVTALGLASSADGSSCELPAGGCGDCGDEECPLPGGDYPDDTFSVSTLSPPPTSEDLLQQAWDRLAVKKNKKSLIWYWMQEYLLEEFYRGNIDEETYQRLSSNYGLTADVASELFYNDYVTSPDVAILGRGFALSMSDLLQSKLNEPIRRFTVDDFSPDALKDYPIFIIPSAGLMGLEKSDVFRVKLDEYVKQGGTLIVFAQQHGYEFSVLPVPQEADGSYNKIGGYGWTEDQSCFYNAAYIETWHQILAGQDKSTPNFHMDGYFTSYPSNATVLLRRTANGQPALLLYEYGQGRVIDAGMGTLVLKQLSNFLNLQLYYQIRIKMQQKLLS